MELLVSYPSDAHPKNRRFDGPNALVLQQAVGGAGEVVPGFNSIALQGTVRRCVAYWDGDAKQRGQPVNVWATLWHMALRRAGYERGLRRADGTKADWLAGNVAVVLSKEPAARRRAGWARRRLTFDVIESAIGIQPADCAARTSFSLASSVAVRPPRKAWRFRDATI